MIPPPKSNYRFLLSLLFRILVFIGLLFSVTPFISRIFNNNSNDISSHPSDNSVVTLSLLDMSVGQIKKINVAYIPIWIYKRRTSEITQLARLTRVLTDPLSVNSIQNKQLQNHYRSYNPVYFVFKPIESLRSCRIRFLDEPDNKLRQILSMQGLRWMGGFTESCFGSVYDLSGRRFAETGNKAQHNLPIPVYSINNTKQQGDVIQFNLKIMGLNK